MAIRYVSDPKQVSAEALGGGFFEGWAEPRTPDQHMDILLASDVVELAVEDETGRVVGFVAVLTDGIQSAFVSLLEAQPNYRHQGIATTLMRRVLDRLASLNGGRGVNVDLSCDDELVPFYERLGMSPGRAMWIRPHLQRDEGVG